MLLSKKISSYSQNFYYSFPCFLLLCFLLLCFLLHHFQKDYSRDSPFKSCAGNLGTQMLATRSTMGCGSFGSKNIPLQRHILPVFWIEYRNSGKELQPFKRFRLASIRRKGGHITKFGVNFHYCVTGSDTKIFCIRIFFAGKLENTLFDALC